MGEIGGNAGKWGDMWEEKWVLPGKSDEMGGNWGGVGVQKWDVIGKMGRTNNAFSVGAVI